MPGEDIFSWSVTAADNGTADTSINWAEGQPRASVNNSARSMLAALAKHRNLTNGSIVTTGTANAQTFTSGVSYTVTPTGLTALLKIGVGLNNTTTTTLNMDGIGAVEIKRQIGTSLVGGELIAGTYAEFHYDGTNWILLRSGGLVFSRIVPQVFTVSTTYTPTVGMIYCIIEAVGGGGGGGGAFGASNYIVGGGGGGGGGYSRKVASAAQIGASQIVTIGAGGVGGSSGASIGGTGGTTSLGSLCLALGGGGGNNPNGVASFPAGGAGAGIGTGDVTGAGNPGDAGVSLGITSGMGAGGNGGGSLFGGGGQGTGANFSTAFNGNPPSSGYGGGGSGACANNIVGGADGGAGSPGLVNILEFVAL